MAQGARLLAEEWQRLKEKLRSSISHQSHNAKEREGVGTLPPERFLSAQLELNGLIKELITEVRRSNQLREEHLKYLRRLWIEAIDRDDLLEESNIAKRKAAMVCSAHFDPSLISSRIHKALDKSAIPMKFYPPDAKCFDANEITCNSLDETPSTSQITLTTLNPLEETTQVDKLPTNSKKTQTTEEYLFNKSSTKRKMTEELASLRLKKRRLEKELTKIKKEMETRKGVLVTNSDEGITHRFVKLVEWQTKLKNRSKGNRYDRQYKTFAYNLRLSSPRAYRCLQTVLKLPCVNTLIKVDNQITPKIEDIVLERVSLKLDSLPANAKYCTICVDQMELTRNLNYDPRTDQVEGLHNINGNHSQEVASHAYVLMIHGIQYDWKQPIAYVFRGSPNALPELDAWVTEAIVKLFSVGIDVRAVVTSLNSEFNVYAKEIKNVTIEDPYFFVEGHKVYYIFDAPQLLVSLRDSLQNSDLFYEGSEISWDYIKILFELQKDKDLRLIPKITNAHVIPNKLNNIKKKQVKYAAEIFSTSVQAALDTYIDFREIADEARGTAKFIKLINDLFDILNSSQMISARRLRNDIKHQGPLRMCPEQKSILEAAQHMFASILTTKYDNTVETNIFQNFLINIQSVTQLFADFKSEGIQHLLTRRLNLESMPGLFESTNMNPTLIYNQLTPRVFSKAFNKAFFTIILENDDKDKEFDIYEMLLKAENIIDTQSAHLLEPPKSTAVPIRDTATYRIDLPDSYALTYVTNCLMSECTKEHKKCQEFVKKLECGRLRVTEEMSEFVQKLERVFAENFERYLLGNVGKELLKLMLAVELPPLPCACFPVEFMVRLFLRMRIYTTLKYNNDNFKPGDTVQYVQVKTL